jgi:dTDP-4-dehydrorhamnose reductase
MKLLLLGKDGQVGRHLQRVLPELGSCVSLGRREVDLTDQARLLEVLRSQSPDVVVNAAAYTAVDQAETDEAGAKRVNAEAVEQLSHYAADTNVLFVHYSTDYVFDGRKAGPYLETDAPNPQTAYGRSKFAGEQAIGASGCNALVFRTSWVFSEVGSNFIKTILRLAGERDALDVVADQHGAPTHAGLIADITLRAIRAHVDGAMSGGLFHLACAGDTTWYEVACHAVQRALVNGVALKLDPNRIRAVTSEQFARPAPRPLNSRLDCTALKSALSLELPDWKLQVEEVVDKLCL